jgi:hypothetical protein
VNTKRRPRQQIEIVAVNEPDPERLAKVLCRFLFDGQVALSDEGEFEDRMKELEKKSRQRAAHAA